VFVLTNQCNLNCEKCFQDRALKETLLTKEQWITLSNDIPSFARITITGGEPLLCRGFAEIFKSVAARHECNLITNGLLLTEEVVDLLLSAPKFKVLAISIDDLRLSPVSIRGLDEKQWLGLEKILRYFIARRSKLGLNCVLEIKTLILNENAGKLSDIHRYCMEVLKADHHTFQFLKGSPLQHSDNLFDIGRIFEACQAPVYEDFSVIVRELNKIKDYNILYDKTAFLHPIVADLNTDCRLNDISFLKGGAFQKQLFRSCRFPWSSLHVNYDGEVLPCLSVPIGNIKEQPIKKILRGRPYRDFLSIIEREGTVNACNGCGWLRLRRNKKKRYKPGIKC
jgi:radical SAM protein with 4Fe4S-binding SPASM domain